MENTNRKIYYTVHFELDDRTANQGAILDNMGNFYSVERYSMEADSDQALCTYNLAGGAANFSGEITLYVEDGNDCGALSVGETISYGGRNYTLQNNNGTLALNIA